MIDEYSEMEINCKCVCQCGLEAGEFYRGIPIHSVNPMTHYRNYKEKLKQKRDENKLRLQLVGDLESDLTEALIQKIKNCVRGNEI
jgi:hypothetical protein